ncbi:type II toxin-antitoxin system VapC family toxin [Promicromonospora iranensis]|uniref:Ribonuclease VapC n=1 Tax=Promicromonospora iranensis TaxID=1105144 RepID=A0ABU2CPJ9_9MICO|nr:type II toxin-antitoxin system VapC family toxin [Promicromonospora iranensis]MDR7383250.1 putative nucleic acid-binding protein [Promicromonospora iranensis]
MVTGSPILVDTSVLIDLLRGNEMSRDVLAGARQFGRSVTGSVLTRTEILGGMRAPEKTRTRKLLDVIEWVDVDQTIADEAGRLARSYRTSHSGIDIADYVIAASTLTTGADLWTRNIKHFPMFPDLAPPY